MFILVEFKSIQFLLWQKKWIYAKIGIKPCYELFYWPGIHIEDLLDY